MAVQCYGSLSYLSHDNLSRTKTRIVLRRAPETALPERQRAAGRAPGLAR
jgi:hypothetical protein